MQGVIEKILNWNHYQRLRKRFPMPEILDRVKTSQIIAQQDTLSLVRYGDGELGQIINCDDLGFQKFDPLLTERLRQILAAEPDPNIMICIPDVFESLRHLREEPRRFWWWWVVSKREALSAMIKSMQYGDAFVTRLYVPWVDRSKELEIVSNLKKAWSGKHVIIVEGEKTRWGVGNDLLDNTASVRRILCPSRNAFSKYSAILEMCRQQAVPDCVFILAVGPTATVLAYDLAKSGMRALDMGHLDLQYEYLRNQSDERIHISGKYNNELKNSEVEECLSQPYLDSIIVDFSHDSDED